MMIGKQTKSIASANIAFHMISKHLHREYFRFRALQLVLWQKIYKRHQDIRIALINQRNIILYTSSDLSGF